MILIGLIIQYSERIYNYFAEILISPSLDRQIEEAGSLALSISLEK
jgi:hypothetical protein